jgi:hypothetical protein
LVYFECLHLVFSSSWLPRLLLGLFRNSQRQHLNALQRY